MSARSSFISLKTLGIVDANVRAISAGRSGFIFAAQRREGLSARSRSVNPNMSIGQVIAVSFDVVYITHRC